MRDILKKVRKRDYDAVKQQAQAIYQAANRKAAEEAFSPLCRTMAKTIPGYGCLLRTRSCGTAGLLKFPRHL
jgi:transposase-like protein